MASSPSTSEGELYRAVCRGCGGSGAPLMTVTLESLLSAEDTNCLTCELLRRVVITYAPGRPSDEKASICRGVGIHELILGDKSEDPLHISFYGHRDPDSPWNFMHEFKGIRDVPAVSIPNIIGNTASPQAMDKVRSWIERCDSNHEDCKLGARSPLPTRVLDVQNQNQADGDTIYLHVSGDDFGEYTCLSHCWGERQPLKTEASTIEARKKGIDWKDLPRTFQDAVTITRILGIRYLWIDSLCIIQDDKEDWRRESAKMHTVYQNGYLTIAASGSPGPGGGLFREAPVGYNLRDWNINGEHIRTRLKIGHMNSARAYPLVRRGWVFQERVLSRRILHFSSEELAWECMEGQDCECGEFGKYIGVEYDFLAPKERYRPVERMKGWLMFVWWKIVKDYSAMQLTYDSDIFPALSGVAELQRAARGSTYVAGLWKDTLIYDLLWHLPKRWGLPGQEVRYQRVPRPTEWRAPTWSWASVRSAVTYEDLVGFEEALVIESVDVGLAGDSLTGQVESAQLRVSGELAEVTVHQPLTNDERNRHGLAYLKFEGLTLHFEEDYDIWGDPKFQMEDGDTLYCLLVGLWFKPESDKNGSDKLWMMVLMEMGAVENYRYTRVGVATLPTTKEGTESCSRFLDSFVQTDDICII